MGIPFLLINPLPAGAALDADPDLFTVDFNR
jgi:hypothetical protein